MKVFISWSGERSHLLAQALHRWLPLVLHYVEPWVSEIDVEAGERWSQVIAGELESSNFGIICVTPENLGSPWVLFEAGALAKSLNGAKVIPLLLGLDFSEIHGPLSQFQAKKVERRGLEAIIDSINRSAEQSVPTDHVKQLFTSLWPKFKKQLESIPERPPTAKHIGSGRLIEEVGETSDGLDRSPTDTQVGLKRLVEEVGETSDELDRPPINTHVGSRSLVQEMGETSDGLTWPRVYDSVADAGPYIIAEIQQLAAPGHSGRLLVQVLGYRLRSVRTLLLHVFDKALDGTRRIENVDFEIFHIDPDYLGQLPLPASISHQNESEYRERMRKHATLLQSNLADFSRYANRSDFRDLGLTCRTIPYCMPPAPCAYVLGSEAAYIGAFNWDDTIGDFAGPRHPCIRVERGQEPFSRYIAWCHNRAKLLANWRG